MALQPPADAHFPTFEDGFTAWQSHALSQGYALKKASCNDKRNGQYTRHSIRCTAGNAALRQSRAASSVTSTADQKCSFEAVAKLYKNAEMWYTYPVVFKNSVY
ncbi:hypothetical protein GGS21DRAFT_522141 [Xylaria nigripes]|nr:hypothetical protein GGS21DRAFT_522141 [Xylaria nigripes]